MSAADFPFFDSVAYASQGNAIIGMRDSGKSYTAIGIAERCALLISEGFFDETATASKAFSELQRRGIGSAKPNVYKACDDLTTKGFLTKEKDGYRTVEGMKVRIVEQ